MDGRDMPGHDELNWGMDRPVEAGWRYALANRLFTRPYSR